MQNTSLWSSPWIPFRLYCRSATAVTNDLILTELDNGQQSLFCNPSLLVIILTETWDAFLDHIVPQWKERSSWGYKKDFVDETLYVLSPAWWLQGWNFNTTFLTHRGTKRSCQFSSVQWLSSVRLFAAPWTAAHQASLSITNSRSLLKLKSIESVRPSEEL